MESSQSVVFYLGISLGAVLSILLIIWLVLFVRLFFGTKGLPESISNFFNLIVEGEIDTAYQLTTKSFRSQTTKKQFLKFIKTNKIKQYKRLRMSTPSIKGKNCTIEITLITKSGVEIPVKMGFIKKSKEWEVDLLENS